MMKCHAYLVPPPLHWKKLRMLPLSIHIYITHTIYFVYATINKSFIIHINIHEWVSKNDVPETTLILFHIAKLGLSPHKSKCCGCNARIIIIIRMKCWTRFAYIINIFIGVVSKAWQDKVTRLFFFYSSMITIMFSNALAVRQRRGYMYILCSIFLYQRRRKNKPDK